MNRYIYLLSAVFSHAIEEEIMSENPCARIEDEPEKERERYLTTDEQDRMLKVMVGELRLVPFKTIKTLRFFKSSRASRAVLGSTNPKVASEILHSAYYMLPSNLNGETDAKRERALTEDRCVNANDNELIRTRQ